MGQLLGRNPDLTAWRFGYLTDVIILRQDVNVLSQRSCLLGERLGGLCQRRAIKTSFRRERLLEGRRNLGEHLHQTIYGS